MVEWGRVPQGLGLINVNTQKRKHTPFPPNDDEIGGEYAMINLENLRDFLLNFTKTEKTDESNGDTKKEDGWARK